MKFNVDMARDDDYECVASDSAQQWGISLEMQAPEKNETCKAWHMQQQDMAKEVSVPEKGATAAYNLCRLFSKHDFHLTNSEYGEGGQCSRKRRNSGIQLVP